MTDAKRIELLERKVMFLQDHVHSHSHFWLWVWVIVAVVSSFVRVEIGWTNEPAETPTEIAP